MNDREDIPPVYFTMSCDIVREKVLILGMNSDRDLALQDASNRVVDNAPYQAFDLTSYELGPNMMEWLVSIGVTFDDAKQIVLDTANSMADMLSENRKKGNIP